MKLFNSPKLLFVFAVLIGLAGVLAFLNRTPSRPSAPVATGAGKGGGDASGGQAAGAGPAAGASNGAAGQAAKPEGAGAAQGGKPGAAQAQGGSKPAAGKENPAQPKTVPAEEGFFARIMRRFRTFLGFEGNGGGFWRRHFPFLFPDKTGEPAAQGQGGAAGAAAAAGGEKKDAAKKPEGPAAPDTSANDEVQRQIKANLEQTLEQQRMMRDLQEIQRQNLENLKMTLQAQQQLKQTTENSKMLKESSRKP